jgi:phage shock protein PspC (stress-responsive transcriptional regulator)
MNEQPSNVRQLTRIPSEGMIAGVCAGFAQYAGIDPTVVRVLAVVGLVVGFPAVFIGYLVAWAIMPRS